MTVGVPAAGSGTQPGSAAPSAEPVAVIGRAREIELLTAALASGAHVVLEGPPGTGKSTLLRQVASARHTPFFLVEGNAELTPARLVGTFDPALVLDRGYRADIFLDGPLVAALRSGGLLYVEELNRVPEETLNVLLTVMSEGELNVPRLGRVVAAPEFRLIAAMNPFDAVGTARISSAVYDRTCRITMGYQDERAERLIVQSRATGVTDGVEQDWLHAVVTLVRATRTHADIRVGSSVRGSIDLVGLATELGRLRARPTTDWQVGLDAAVVSLSGRIRLQPSCTRTPEEVVEQLYRQVFGARESTDSTGQDGEGSGKA